MKKYLLSMSLCLIFCVSTTSAQSIQGFPNKILIQIDSVWGSERELVHNYIRSNLLTFNLELLKSRLDRSLDGEGSFEIAIASDAKKIANFLIAITKIATKVKFKLSPQHESSSLQEFEVINIESSKFTNALLLILRMGILPTSISEGVISFEFPMTISSAQLLVALKSQGFEVVNKADRSPAKVKSGYVYQIGIGLNSSKNADSFTKKLLSRYQGFKFIRSARESGSIVITYRLILDPKKVNPEQEITRISKNLRRWKDIRSVAVSLVGRANITVPRPDITVPRPPEKPSIEAPRPGIPIPRPMPAPPVNEERVLNISLIKNAPFDPSVDQIRAIAGVKVIKEMKRIGVLVVEVEEKFNVEIIKNQIEKLSVVSAVEYNVPMSIPRPTPGVGALPPSEFGPKRPMPVKPSSNQKGERRVLLVALSEIELPYTVMLAQIRAVQGVKIVNELPLLRTVVVEVDRAFDLEIVKKQLQALNSVSDVRPSLGEVSIPRPMPQSRFDLLVEDQKKPANFNQMMNPERKVTITIHLKHKTDAQGILAEIQSVKGYISGEVLEYRGSNVVLLEVDASVVESLLVEIEKDSRILRVYRTPDRRLQSSSVGDLSRVSEFDLARMNAETAAIQAEINCRHYFSR